MSVDVRSWLPRASLLDGRLEARMAQIADLWAKKWCVGSAEARVRLVPAGLGLPSPPGPMSWSGPHGGVRLALSSKSVLIVARAMLGLKRLPPGKAARDLALIKSLETEAVSDLAVSLGSLVPECRAIKPEAEGTAPRAPEGRDDEGVILSLELAGQGAMLDLFIREDLASAARRRLCAAAVSPRPLGDVSQALAGQDILVSARAGRGSLTLAEFNGLGIGDVLILDRSLDAGLDVIINGKAVSQVRCDIVEAASGVSLQITGARHAG